MVSRTTFGVQAWFPAQTSVWSEAAEVSAIEVRSRGILLQLRAWGFYMPFRRAKDSNHSEGARRKTAVQVRKPAVWGHRMYVPCG